MPQVGEETKLDVGPRMVDTGSATGAGDGLRTRYLNLGNKVFRIRIRMGVLNPLCALYSALFTTS